MKVPSLLRKEALWSRHRAVTLLLLLVVLPGFFAFTTVAFQTVVPQDAPIAIVPESDAVTEDGLDIIEAGATLFSDPQVYDEKDRAMRALRREQVYAVLEVPPGILDESTRDATFTLYIDGGVVPFEEPSRAIRSIMAARLDANLPADVRVEREVVGAERTLSEYLVPVFLLGLLMLFAFTYLPYNLARERDVLDRVLATASLDALVAAKLLTHTLLMLVPIGAFAAATSYLGYSVDLLAPGAVAVSLLTFLYLGAVSTTVMLLTGFSTLGRFCNVALLFGTLTFSSLVYPVGFFSVLRKEIARAVPLHYSMVVTRGLTLKGADIALFADHVLGLVGFTAVTLVVLKLAIVTYERRA